MSRGMSQHTIAAYESISSARMVELIDRKIGRKVKRLDGMLHDPAHAHDLVFDAVIDAIRDAVRRHPETTVTEPFVAKISSSIKLERVFTQHLGMPASLKRAGELYEKHKGELRAAGVRVPGDMSDAECWDEAVLDNVGRQESDHAAGARRSIRYLPLHDGASSSPSHPSLLSCGGLAEWNRLVHGRDHADYEGEIDEQFMLADRHAPDPQDLFEPDAAWLAEHGVTPGMADRLSDDQIRAAGVDPAWFRSQYDHPSHSGSVTDTLTLVLQSGRAACRLAGMLEGSVWKSAEAILTHMGLGIRLAATGLAFEQGMRDHPQTDRQAMWDHACARMAARARDVGAMPGRMGFERYLRASATLCELLESGLDETSIRERMGEFMRGLAVRA